MTEQGDAEGLPTSKGPASIQDRIAAFQMLDAMLDSTQAQKIVRLALVGFNRNDIAAMLQTSPQNVSQALYSERKKAQKPAKPAKAKPTPDSGQST